MKNKYGRFTPLWMAVCVVLGILVGTFYANHFSGNRLNIINSSGNKLNNLLRIIDDQYVDTVDINNLVEKAMPQILAELDPHSVYITAREGEIANDDLRGSFFGIGIEFVIRQDTIRVQNVIGNGPAERAGVLAGDKIVEVDDSIFVGKICTNAEAMHRLKGPKDTKVKLGILRYGEKKLRHITITRGEIPTKSITSSYMLDNETGYIRIKNFGENTYPELLIALAKLSQQNFSNLVIDLRSNTGGYLESAVQIANEFLSRGQLIVYTQGRAFPRQDYRADGRGSYQSLPLVVLVDEASASASEILAGAIQDNDRGTIIGRRSFGKGLVQKPMEFSDHSMIRLTIARYYTPSGRCIQKPYTDGSHYDDDWVSRYQHGEFFSVDSIKHTGPEYHTLNGRVVYGGGGIVPDKLLSYRKDESFVYYNALANKGLINMVAFRYVQRHAAELLRRYPNSKSFGKGFMANEAMLEELVREGVRVGIERNSQSIAAQRPLIMAMMKAYIGLSLYGNEAFYEAYLPMDEDLKETINMKL